MSSEAVLPHSPDCASLERLHDPGPEAEGGHFDERGWYHPACDCGIEELVKRTLGTFKPRCDRDPVRCPDCWKGKPIPCAVGCRDSDECCDKNLDGPCERCGGTGWLGAGVGA